MRRQLFWPLFGVALAFGAIPLAGQGRGRGGAPVNLPEGPAKESIQTLCTTCHTLNNIVNSGAITREGWQTDIGTWSVLPGDQREAIIDYLAKNFPEQPRPPAVIIPGSA
jgi:hypothetical protein